MTEQPYSLPNFIMSQYHLYRLDDWIFWSLLTAGLTFCMIHAARRAFRQPFPTEPGAAASILITGEIERHNLVQRILHWSNAIAVITLTISGWMIYRPISPERPASVWFFWHRWAVALLFVGLAFHLVYESFIVRRPNPMAASRAETGRVWAILKNFFGVSNSYPRLSKYHPGQIFFHWLVAGNLFLLTLTGFIIWKPFRDLLPLSLLGLSWDFIFYSRLLHDFFTATLIASLFAHIYFAVLIKKNWKEAKSIFTGRVPSQEYLLSHLDGP